MQPNPDISTVGSPGGAASTRLALDRIALDIAAEQHGVVTRSQLLAAGASAKMIGLRLKRGRLRSMHRGVYLVASVEPPMARAMAACLACGPESLVSHRSAAELWGLVDPGSPGHPIAVTTTGPDRRPSGIRVHRSTTLDPSERTRLDGVPITTPLRTLLDLTLVERSRTVERALATALAQGRTTEARLTGYLQRHAGRPGTSRLRTILSLGPPARTRSEAEERFLTLVRRAGMPRPRVNVRIGPWEVDFHWADARLVVEVDGFASHHSGRAFERDRRRDGYLLSRGLQVMRITWRQIEDEPEGLAFRLGQVLASNR